MKSSVFPVAVLGAVLASIAPIFAQEKPEDDPLNAVVKIEVTTSVPDFVWPWRVNLGSGSGSGVVISPGQILTCAHCVTDSTFIRIRKNNEDDLFHAEPLFIDNDRDLALLKVDDPAFMRGIVPMEIGETPPVQSEVVAVGYPRGGRLISFTRGIVSRIEDIRYSQGWTVLLAAQVDAAINPGNSGGPVLDMKTFQIAGIAFQGRDDGESLGYMIPTDIIRCFLKDVEDKRLDGTPDLLFAADWLESEAKRRYLGMKPDQTGLLVTHVSPSLGDQSIHVDDVILEIDGYRVANNGNIRLEGNRIRSRAYPFYMRQIGESVPVKVLRGGDVVDLSVPVRKFDTKSKRFLHDEKPDYFVFGGLVFTTLSYSYSVSAKTSYHDDDTSEDKESPEEFFVMLSDVLGDVCTEGYFGAGGVHVRSVNGEKIRNLRHLVKLVEACQDEFVRFGVDADAEWDYLIAVDNAEMKAALPRVMERYQIPADRSEDLRTEPKP